MVRVMGRGAAWVVTLLVLSLSTVEMPHLVGLHHDGDFDIIVVAHDASAHHIGGGQIQETRPEHCLACHWGRSFKPGGDTASLGAPVDGVASARVFEQPLAQGRPPVALPPLRSPPLSPLFA